MIHVFRSSLFSVGEHVIADVPRSGLAASGPDDDDEKKKQEREEEDPQQQFCREYLQY